MSAKNCSNPNYQPRQTLLEDVNPTARENLRWTIGKVRKPEVRPISQWVEEEVVLPTGQHKNKRFRHQRHPVSKIWFRELDRGVWWRHATVAPTQNGKTLMCYVLPVLYYLFELNETVIIGLPDMRMANDKWERDFLPVIQASRYRDLLPSRGEGSKGGKIKNSVTFSNGAMLRFMSAGGGDKARAGFAGCRVVAITETDGMDEAGESSREGDPCRQIENRLRSYHASQQRVFMECTASIPSGKIWQEYTQNTLSRIARPCPYCDAYVTPEREHLKGWQEAVSAVAAESLSHWHCPECDQAWSEEDRRWGWQHAVLVHDGQTVDTDGTIHGDAPETRTLGFRWGAIDNPFTTAGECGAEEWRAARVKDKEGAEKNVLQATNAWPWESPDESSIELELEDVSSRVVPLKRGVVPPGCIGISVGVDTHARDLYWEAKAVVLRDWLEMDEDEEAEGMVIERGQGRRYATLHVIDHQILKLNRNQLAREAILGGLKRLKRQFDAGWLDESGKRWAPAQVWIDSGYAAHKTPVYTFCAAANQGLHPLRCIWRPAKGHGEGQLRTSPYRAPENVPSMQTKSNRILHVGNDYYISRIMQGQTEWVGVQLVHVNSDTWKTHFHGGFRVPPDQPGAVTLFEDTTSDRDVYESQLCGEVQREKFVKYRGLTLTWHQIGPNHYLDAGYLSTAAADFVVKHHEVLTGKRQPRKQAADYSKRAKAAAVQAYANRAMAGARR